MKTKATMYVDMTDVIGQLAIDYNIPVLRFDQLVKLGQRAVIVYNLDSRAKRVRFDEICNCISEFVRTPFGARMLREAQNDLE